MNIKVARIRKDLVALIAVGVMFAMCADILTSQTNPAYAADITGTPERISYDSAPRVPVVESTIGRGTVSTTSEGEVALPGIASASTVLVRISIFSAAKDADVTVAGSPALHVAQGQDASTTVLSKVKDGRISIGANTTVDARVEVLAVFGSNASAPGSTIALDAPVTRLNSAEQLGVVSAGSASESFGVVGLGGVPATDVRAVYLTMSVDANAAGKVVLGGEQLAVPAGHSVISTIAVPDADGNVQFASDQALANARVDVRGYVAGAPQNAEYANVSGSYVPVDDSAWHTASAAPGEDGSVTLPELADSDLGIALVSGAVTSPTSDEKTHTFIDVGKTISGRSSGVLVDNTAGALPQLEVVEDAEGATPLSVRGVAVKTNALLLGDVLGEKPTSKSVVNVAISSPKQDDTLDFGKTGGIEIKGTVKSQSAIESVDIYGNDVKIGTASLAYNEDGGSWEYDGAAPKSGIVRYEAKALTRDGSAAEASLRVNVQLPDPDATVIDPDVVIIDAANSPVVATDSSSVTLNQAPNFAVGNIIVSDTSEAAPKGFLRWVDAIQRTGDKWKITTHQATLTDAIIQGSTSSEDSTDNPQLAKLSDPTTPQGEPVTVVDGPEEPVKLLNSSADDSAANAAKTKVSTFKAESASITPAAETEEEWVDSDPRDATISKTVEVEQKYTLGKPEDEVSAKFTGSYGDVTSATEISAQPAEEEKKAEKAITAEGGTVFGVKLTGELGLRFGLAIKVKWDWDFTNDIDYLKTEVYTSLSQELSIASSGSITWKPKEITLKHFEAGQTIPLGIPVYVSYGTDLTLEPEVTVSGKASWTKTDAVESQLGAQHHEGADPDFVGYANTRKKPDEESETTCAGEGFSVEFTAEISVGIGVEVGVYLLDTAGPSFKGTPSVGIEGKLTLPDTGKNTLTVTGYVELSGQAFFTMKIPIIDKNLAEWNSPKLSVKHSLGFPIDIPISSGCKPSDGSGGGGAGTSWDDAKDVTIKWTDPKSGKTHSDSVKSGTEFKITQADLESRLGLSAGALDGAKGVSAEADGKGNVTRIGNVFQATEDATLHVFYVDSVLPDIKDASTDIVFVIDSTGSMYDEIDSVDENVKNLADAIGSAAKDYRIALVDYKDADEFDMDPYQSRVDVDFTTDLDKFKSGVDSITAAGGGDWQESVYSGVNTALDLKWRDGVRKSVFIIGDAPGKDPEPVTNLTHKDIVTKAKKEDVALYPLGRGVETYSSESAISPFSAVPDLSSPEEQEQRQSAHPSKSAATADGVVSLSSYSETPSVPTLAAADESDSEVEDDVDESSFEGFTRGLADETGGTYTSYTADNFVDKLLDIVVKATQAPDVTVGASSVFHTGETVNLNVTTNASSEDPVVGYDWNFGTGTPSDESDATTTEGSTKTVFSKAGTYTINVAAHTKQGATGHGALTIKVIDRVPTTTFSGMVTLPQGSTALLVLPVVPGTEGYGTLTFDNGSASKVIPGEGEWRILRSGNSILAEFTPESGFTGKNPATQTYFLTDGSGQKLNGKLTTVYQ